MSRRKREIRDYLHDILEYSEKAQRFLSGVSTAEALVDDEMRLLATVRALEVIGEAVKHLPASVRRRYPQVPWQDIAGMRDILIHGYYNIDIQNYLENCTSGH